MAALFAAAALVGVWLVAGLLPPLWEGSTEARGELADVVDAPDGRTASSGSTPSDRTSGRMVAISRDDRKLVALDPDTGTVRWEAALPGDAERERAFGQAPAPLERRHPQLIPAVGDDLFVAGPGWLAVFAPDGEHRWTVPLVSHPKYIQQDDHVVLLHASRPDAEAVRPEQLVAYDTRTGKRRWELDLWSVVAILREPNLSVIAATAPDRLARLDARDGEPQWEVRAVEARWSPSSQPSVLATSPAGGPVRIDPLTGEVRAADAVPPARFRSSNRGPDVDPD